MIGLRVDKWLWFARFCKTRGQAQRLVDGGMVTVNGRLVERSSAVTPGDEIVLPVHPEDGGCGLRRLKVVALGQRRGPPALARALYLDLGQGRDTR